MRNAELDVKLRAIGFQFAGASHELQKDVSSEELNKKWVDIEATLLDACYEIEKDARLLSFLMSWIKVHGDYVITEKLMKLARKQERARGKCQWLAALAAFAAHVGQHKWKKLIVKHSTPLYLHSQELSQSALRLKGREDFLADQNIHIAKGSLRIRESDVSTPEQLVLKNRQYRNRYLYGASWRADIITAIEVGFENPFQIAKTLGCSYEPAHRIFSEYRVAMLAR
jgi:hypothetical protein